MYRTKAMRNRCNSDSDEENRELMRAWLVNQLNQESIRGLEWHNGQKTCFRVPWVHGSRRCWTKTDGEVFMKWALHTGKYVQGKDRPDHKKWKANFRCAINSLPDVVEMRDQSCKRGASAYRVYQLQEEKARRSKCRRFTGRHIGKGNRPKSLRIRQKSTLQKGCTKIEPLDDDYESENRVPRAPSPTYSDGIYSPTPSSSPSSASSSSECSASLLQPQEMDSAHAHPTYSPHAQDDEYLATHTMTDSSLAEPYCMPLDIESEYIIGNDEEDDETLNQIIADPLPHISTIFDIPNHGNEFEEGNEFGEDRSDESAIYTELAPVAQLAKCKIEQFHHMES